MMWVKKGKKNAIKEAEIEAKKPGQKERMQLTVIAGGNKTMSDVQ